MMRTLRHLQVLLALTAASPALAASWLTDLGTARQRVAAENKPLLICFTGSDWCPACQKLRAEVFSRPEFGAFADANLILVEADFPRRHALPAAQKQANASLAQTYRVQDFPTLVLLDTRGEEVARPRYSGRGVGDFLSSLQSVLRRAGLASGSPPGAKRGPDSPPPPLFNGAPTAPPPRYSGLTLKNISGSRQRRFALINNQTFATGDVARVKIEDREVMVRCLEIREAAVIVMVEGQPERQELKLADAH